MNSILKDKSGAVISYKYSGIITLTPAIAAVLGGAADAKTTDFGNVGELTLESQNISQFLLRVLQAPGNGRGRAGLILDQLRMCSSRLEVMI